MTLLFRHDLAGSAGWPSTTRSSSSADQGRQHRAGARRQPPDSHIGLAEVADEDGEELDVYRRSVPWADAAEQGLQCVSFGRDIDRFDLQLRHIYGEVDPDLVDRLLSFTTALSGSFWFCPSVEDLDAIAPVPDEDD